MWTACGRWLEGDAGLGAGADQQTNRGGGEGRWGGQTAAGAGRLCERQPGRSCTFACRLRWKSGTFFSLSSRACLFVSLEIGCCTVWIRVVWVRVRVRARVWVWVRSGALGLCFCGCGGKIGRDETLEVTRPCRATCAVPSTSKEMDREGGARSGLIPCDGHSVLLYGVRARTASGAGPSEVISSRGPRGAVAVFLHGPSCRQKEAPPATGSNNQEREEGRRMRIGVCRDTCMVGNANVQRGEVTTGLCHISQDSFQGHDLRIGMLALDNKVF